MDIHQVSVDYQHEQDRILVRINTRQDQEIRLWLTRRLCSGWIPVLRHSISALGQTALQTPANNAAHGDASAPSSSAASSDATSDDAEEADFSTPFKAEPAQWPLGSEPLLITTVRMTPQAEHRLELAFEESLSGQERQARGFQVSFEPKLLNGLMHLLDQALTQAEWQGSTHGSIPSEGMGLADGLIKPKYLH